MVKAATESIIDASRTKRRPISEASPASCSAAYYRFRLAEAGDDAQIRHLLRETPMKGSVSITLRTEPSYFQTIPRGSHHQTLVACEESSGQIVGMGTRSVQTRYVDEAPTNVGYLSGLRILQSHRKGTLLARGYREMRRLHEDQVADYYLTTIVDGNQPAIESLLSGRASLPAYEPLGRYYTFVLPLRYRRRFNQAGVRVRAAAASDLPALVDFLNQEGKSRQFFPCYRQQDLPPSSSVFQGLRVEDIFTAWRNDELLGVVGIWNQNASRQCVIEGYSSFLRVARPAMNLAARCVGYPTFPDVGQPFPTTFATFPLVKNDDPEILSQLLDAARIHVRDRHPGFHSILIGAFERDPMLDSLKRMSLHRFVSHVFLVHWDKIQLDRFLHRNLYLELGCL